MADERRAIVIIGSGAGGAPLAQTLVQAGHDVLMLEKGPLLRTQQQAPDGLSDFKRDELFATGAEKRLTVPGMANVGASFYSSHVEPDLNDEPHVYRDSDGQDRATIEGYTAQVVGGGTELYDWTPDPAADELTAFVRHAIALQRAHATLRRRDFLRGDGDVAWSDATGARMSDARWSDPGNHFVALLLAGDRADEPDDDVLVVLNADDAEHAFVVPGEAGTRRFDLLLDTAFPDGIPADGAGVEAGETLTVAPRTVLVAAAPR